MSLIFAAYPDTRYLKTQNSTHDTYWYPVDKLHVTLAYHVNPEPAIVSQMENLRNNYNLKLWFGEKSEFKKDEVYKLIYSNVCIFDSQQTIPWNSFIKNLLQSFGFNEFQLSAFAYNDALHMSIGETTSSYRSTVEISKKMEAFWVPIKEFKYYLKEKEIVNQSVQQFEEVRSRGEKEK